MGVRPSRYELDVFLNKMFTLTLAKSTTEQPDENHVPSSMMTRRSVRISYPPVPRRAAPLYAVALGAPWPGAGQPSSGASWAAPQHRSLPDCMKH